MRLHALVGEAAAAEAALAGGATVVQLRAKGRATAELVELGRPILAACRAAGAVFVVNDDIEAALRLGADGVHLGRGDEGGERALAEGLLLGLSASTVREAAVNEHRGAGYLGVGPVWPTPSKDDADPAIGLDGLALVCAAVSVPVVAIGGIDASNAADCVGAGATGVAVVRAAADARAILEALDAAL
jgi:thiamine-phosphate pyrophosphorylase